MGNRALSVIRLSDYRFDFDSSNSPEKQEEVNTDYANRNGLQIIGKAPDLDVSASVSPWEREQLGDWLKNRAHEFDVIIAWKIDRLARSIRDFTDLLEWARKNGKAIVCVQDNFDLSTAQGRLVAHILAIFAEFERDMISQRAKGEYDRKVRDGFWVGSVWPFGYRPEDTPGGKKLARDPVTAPIVEDIVSRVIAGQSVNSICADLNKRGVPTAKDHQIIEENRRKPEGAKKREPKGSKWMSGTLGNMLRTRIWLGHWEGAEPSKDRKGNKGKVFTDRDGLEVQRAEPIISQDDWEKVQKALDRNKSKTGGNNKQGSFLLRIAFCGICEQVMHSNTKGDGKRYYKCKSGNVPGAPGCGNKMVRADALEPLVERQLLGEVGHTQTTREIFVPGEDNTEQLNKVKKALERLKWESDNGLVESEDEVAQYQARLKALTENRRYLESLPQREAEWVYEPTGETFAQMWEGKTPEERSQYLRENNFRALVDGTSGEDHMLAMDLGELEFMKTRQFVSKERISA